LLLGNPVESAEKVLSLLGTAADKNSGERRWYSELLGVTFVMFHLKGILSISMTKEQYLVNAAGITNGQSRIPARQKALYILFSQKTFQKKSRTNKFLSPIGKFEIL
jgi:hypothetical protein